MICFLCGLCPNIISTDGNTKDSIKVNRKMQYDYSDNSEIPDFCDFKDGLIEELLCTALFQQKSKTVFNMLKIPVLMPPCLQGKKVNNDCMKQTIMEKEYKYSDETLKAFQEMVEQKVVKISSIKDLTVNEMQELGAQLGLLGKKKGEKKSVEVLKLDMINLCNIFLGGQVI